MSERNSGLFFPPVNNYRSKAHTHYCLLRHTLKHCILFMLLYKQDNSSTQKEGNYSIHHKLSICEETHTNRFLGNGSFSVGSKQCKADTSGIYEMHYVCGYEEMLSSCNTYKTSYFAKSSLQEAMQVNTLGRHP